jgi:hypothetical protein
VRYASSRGAQQYPGHGASTLGLAPAWADPADGAMGAPPVPPGPVFVPSSPPATAKSTDGWTLTLSASGESQTPSSPQARDFIVGGLFNGTLRGPRQATTPTPSGTIEVGYQIECFGAMMAASKPNVVNV